MAKQKVYISGKITGIEKEAPAIFEAAEKILTERGYDVVNPMKLKHDHDKTWHSYMREDVAALCSCQCFCMLDNYANSKGAIIEQQIALMLGLTEVYL